MNNKIFYDNEIKTNKIASKEMLSFSIFVGIFGVLGQLNILDLGPDWATQTVIFTSITMIILYACLRRADFSKPYVKGFIVTGIIILSGVMFFLYTSNTAFLLYGPILVSIKYWNKQFVLKISALSWLMCIIVLILNMVLYNKYEYFKAYKEMMSSIIWESTLDVVLYLIIPKTMMFIVTAAIAYIITDDGRRLFTEEFELLKKNNEIDSELKAVASIQKASLPPLSYESPDGDFNIRAYMNSAKDVGGDFYDYFNLNEYLKVGIIADVSDKGLSAAVFSMKAQTILRYTIKNNLEVGFYNDALSLDIEKALGALNNIIIHNQAEGIFITAFIVCIDIRTGVGKYINAGHMPPYIVHQDGTYELVESEPQVFLGAIPDVQYKASVIKMNIGDTLFMYTDGITDARNADDVVFGNEGIEKAFGSLEDDFDAEKVAIAVENEVNEFIGKEDQFDDMTILSCQYTGETHIPTTSVEIMAETDAITIAVNHFNEFLLSNHCPELIIKNADVVIDEMCSNIIKHGYQGYMGMITIGCRLSKNSITLRFKDNAPKFDITKLEEKVLPDEPEIGGLGIHLVRSMADDISYEYVDGHNVITLIKVWNI